MKPIIRTFVAAFALVIGVGGSEVSAQFDQMFTQYSNNEMFVNPAYAGSKDAMAFTVLHRQQWVGFPGRPITTTFSINTPLMRGKMGVGLSYLNEKVGVLNRNLIYASYAYRIRTGAKGHLSFGLMGGAHLQIEKVTDLPVFDSGDPLFSSDLGLIATPNFGFGMYYNTEKFYLSLSIPRLLDDHVRFTETGVYDKGIKFNYKSLHYYLALGRLFTISDNFKLKPHMMTKFALNTPVEFDINVDALIREKLWVGLSYRSNADISALVGLQINPSLLVSYSYDYQVTRIHKHSAGSHEICLSYLFEIRNKKIISPRYF
jgi:type IX secretion system PorP/SprF family membrane protein